jgi:hypothetical protein
MNLDGDILTIHADVNKDFEPSSSGMTIIAAHTEDTMSIPGSEENKIELNISMKKCLSDRVAAIRWRRRVE